MNIKDLKKQKGFSLDIAVITLIEIFEKKLDMKSSEITNCLWYFLRNQRAMLKRENKEWSDQDLNHNTRIWLRKQNQATDTETNKQIEIELLRQQIGTAKALGMSTEKYEEKLKILEGGTENVD